MAKQPIAEICFVEFLDDYFVECEEHLAVARRSLLALDAFVGKPHIDGSLLDELFRTFHSLKGLSAMVAVREAELLAHEMESYLSALRKGQVRLGIDGLDGLIEGVKTLEQVIASRREEVSAPNVEPLITRLAALSPVGQGRQGPSQESSHQSPSGLSADKALALANAIQKGARAWRFMFTPSPALAERGINVNTVRQRLQEAGDLIHAAPQVLGQGLVSFSFLVASHADESAFRVWEKDGLSYAPAELSPVEPAAASQQAEPAAKDVAGRSAKFVSNLNETAASIEETTASIQSVSGKAQEMAASATQVRTAMTQVAASTKNVARVCPSRAVS